MEIAEEMQGLFFGIIGYVLSHLTKVLLYKIAELGEVYDARGA